MGMFDGVDKRWLKFGGEALQDLGYGLSRGTDFGQALGYATQRTQDMQPARDAFATQQKAEAERQQQLNQTVEWARNAFPDKLAGVPEHLVGDMAIDLWTQQFTGGANPASFSQTPVFLTDPEGNQHIGQMSSGGGVLLNGEVLPSLPSGWSIIARPDNMRPVDGGDRQWVFNPNTGQYEAGPMKGGAPSANMDVSPAPGGGRIMTPAAGSPEAATQGANIASAKQAVDTVKEVGALLRDEEGLNEQFGNILGIPQRWGPAYPGSEMGNWQAAFEQAKGQAFMQARAMLKGGGPITDWEGQVGAAAMSRMEAAVRTGDKATFLDALEDFEAAVEQGYQKLAAASGVGAAPGGQTSTGIPWRVEQ
jgi:hypothetical protein